MTRETYQLIENYMLECMDPGDVAHGTEHIRRVLYAALDIATHEENVNTDVLICACLLHDIARKAQTANRSIHHSTEGAKMARAFLSAHNFEEAFTDHAADCIRTHSSISSSFNSIEAKILFDADKLDVAGALGIARTLQYGAQFGEPLYARDEEGNILDGSEDIGPHSFLHEYHHDLRKTINGFHTARANEIAATRRQIAEDFYRAILCESREAEHLGKHILQGILSD